MLYKTTELLYESHDKHVSMSKPTFKGRMSSTFSFNQLFHACKFCCKYFDIIEIFGIFFLKLGKIIGLSLGSVIASFPFVTYLLLWCLNVLFIPLKLLHVAHVPWTHQISISIYFPTVSSNDQGLYRPRNCLLMFELISFCAKSCCSAFSGAVL